VMCHTDPLYGVSYSGGDNKWQVIKGDHKRDDDLLSNLLVPALRLAVKHTTPDAPFYIWHANATRRDFDKAIDITGLMEKQYIVWVKDSIVLGHADYHWQHEPCIYAQKGGEACRWFGDRKQATIWRVRPPAPADLAASVANGIRISDGEGNAIFISAKAPKSKKTRLIRLADGDNFSVIAEHSTDAWEIGRDAHKDRKHPTQKPVKLFDIPIQNHTQVGEMMVEPFSGSGAQFLAAHATGRRCYGFELDPKYCAVILERMEEAGITGKLESANDKAKPKTASRKPRKKAAKRK